MAVIFANQVSFDPTFLGARESRELRIASIRSPRVVGKVTLQLSAGLEARRGTFMTVTFNLPTYTVVMGNARREKRTCT